MQRGAPARVCAVHSAGPRLHERRERPWRVVNSCEHVWGATTAHGRTFVRAVTLRVYLTELGHQRDRLGLDCVEECRPSGGVVVPGRNELSLVSVPFLRLSRSLPTCERTHQRVRSKRQKLVEGLDAVRSSVVRGVVHRRAPTVAISTLRGRASVNICACLREVTKASARAYGSRNMQRR